MQLRQIFLLCAGLLAMPVAADAADLTLKPGSAAAFILKPARAASADTTAPVTTAGPTVSGTSDIATSLSATINEAGVGYYLVQPAAAAAPNVATVLASGTSFSMAANTANTQNIVGLTGSTSYLLYFVARDTRNNVQTAVASVAFTTLADTTPPITTAGPSIPAKSDTAATLSATLNETGIGYYLVKLATDPAPSVASVKAGTPIAMSANASASTNITGLTGSTNYIVYFIAKDASNNWQASASQVALATDADTTPPNTTAGPSVSATTATTTVLSATINEAGTGYYLVQLDAAAAPSVATLLASPNNFAMVANTAANPGVTGLTAGTAYKIYFVAKDASNNVQAAVQMAAFSTTANPCFSATNSAHASAGRASYSFVSFAWRYLANGSSNDMGTLGTTTTKLRQTGANYFIIDASCP
ncbi:hypothetical protein [Janthinobacterium sp. 17J80-10]|uniref:hypothetical protein n=1 Tax=Janthinobacterium sp. 17J80-10 TaxID=2497863 RepID=UPI0010059334|nr:hypothetical protein [Janthinobacterium sp. 17J80-10]QAU35243.1 hypothetical protein EKL02_14235 [Janthinobacterium sp. 17J80-10]